MKFNVEGEAEMLESTNALIGALIAVLRELQRCRSLIDGGLLSEEAEEEMGPFIDQLHEALADLSESYESRRAAHPNLLTLEQLEQRAKIT
ncbi:hypothetical protein Metme_4172 [Methylomonas methanica MC09]|uniref:Uncharacterized protein n=2 Tax=Methylomonas methanica TaxID=421 RepID=G0A1A3_METMM|nr:hypothetical protein Metme_4172 [Methylomonas methanica MC09]